MNAAEAISTPRYIKKKEHEMRLRKHHANYKKKSINTLQFLVIKLPMFKDSPI
jgi:hypothetical protein